jgi:hypothetical protein
MTTVLLPGRYAAFMVLAIALLLCALQGKGAGGEQSDIVHYYDSGRPKVFRKPQP